MRSVVDRNVVMRRMTNLCHRLSLSHTEKCGERTAVCVFDPQTGISKETRVWTNKTSRCAEDCADYTVADVQQTHWPRKHLVINTGTMKPAYKGTATNRRIA